MKCLQLLRIFPLVLLSVLFSCSKEAEKTNIVIFLCDDLGYGDQSAYGHPVIQTLVLWLISQIMAIVVGSAYALAAGWLRNRFIARGALSGAGDYFAGCVYIGLGLAVALTGSKSR